MLKIWEFLEYVASKVENGIGQSFQVSMLILLCHSEEWTTKFLQKKLQRCLLFPD